MYCIKGNLCEFNLLNDHKFTKLSLAKFTLDKIC